ncbi:hypothetical protein CEE37_08080 [candidate division LCP-89 bacterium B3_LCP]|uniref:Spore protein YkvP/CgeB glycosyl transferase-like domain-containing protein n=1 Tax=candidate division LCP-89 bacterium B3_LCP TaxID=2012998 RepID=A0A532UZ90_UNCL8|nr:MAG: hypothetical protein CEE37_08080 [candidate division LCP-89 bacterium B3_LCP]
MPSNNLEGNLKKIAASDERLADLLRQSYDPGYPEIRTAKSGEAIPVVNKKCLHSTYNPIAEAQKWMESCDLHANDNKTYVLGGIGFGYHVDELLKIIPPERLIIVEKDPGLAAAVLANRPVGFLPDKVRLLVGLSAVQSFERIIRYCASQNDEIFFLEHPASSSLYPDFYITLKGIVKAQWTTKRGGYKILLVSPLYGGSLPISYHVHDALNKLGHRCELLDNSVFYPGMQHLNDLTSNKNHQSRLDSGLTTLLAESVTARALEIKADLVLGMAQSPLTPEVLRELKKAGIQTAFWFIEDLQILEYWKALVPFVENFFAIQKGEYAEKLKENGCPFPNYLPLAANPDVHNPMQLTQEEESEFGGNVSHVGAGYHNRRNFFAGLLDLDFKIWGNDWDNPGTLKTALQREGERINTEDSTRIFNTTKINVNLHSSTYHDGINPFGDYLNPRTFEIAACGAFQLVDNRQYLSESFEVGDEIITFDSIQDCRERIVHYLANPHERIEIAGRARQRVLTMHTYEHRMLELLGVIAGRNPHWTPQGGGLPTAEEIIVGEKPGSALAGVMERFKDRGPLTLEDIASEIEKGEGELSRTEGMILLLNEFRRWGVEKGVL